MFRRSFDSKEYVVDSVKIYSMNNESIKKKTIYAIKEKYLNFNKKLHLRVRFFLSIRLPMMIYHALSILIHKYICKCHQLKIDFSFLIFLTSIWAYDSQARTETTSVERQNVYTNLYTTEISATDHSMIVKVMMPVIIKSNVPFFLLLSSRWSCYMSNDN